MKLEVIWKIMENTSLLWRDLGDEPSLQFYNEAITVAPESEAARNCGEKILNLKNGERTSH